MRYANNSQYKSDKMIRKEAYVTQPVLDELKRIIVASEVEFAFSCGIIRSPQALNWRRCTDFQRG